MPAPEITPLPPAPLRTDDGATFSAKAEAWSSALPDYGQDMLALANYVSGRADELNVDLSLKLDKGEYTDDPLDLPTPTAAANELGKRVAFAASREALAEIETVANKTAYLNEGGTVVDRIPQAAGIIHHGAGDRAA
jgi:hypothetical protein